MRLSLFKLSRKVKRRLIHRLRKTQSADTRQRYQIIILRGEHRSPTQIHHALKCARSTVYRTLHQFQEEGDRGLQDQRSQAHPSKVTWDYLKGLWNLVAKSPRDYGWNRSTWTQELLARQMQETTGVEISRTYMGRLLRRLKIHRRRACPVLRIPVRGRQKRLEAIRQLLEDLPATEAVFYQDEADIDLNPRIGSDYMRSGQQKKIPTPGQNQKRYVAGALHAQTGNVVWVEGEKKTSQLFLALLKELLKRYRKYRVIHLILDNYIIHKSRATLRWLGEKGKKIRLHFLPAYSPNENRIEKLWKQLHDNVTRNHRFQHMEELMHSVHQFLEDVIPFPGSQPSLQKIR